MKPNLQIIISVVFLVWAEVNSNITSISPSTFLIDNGANETIIQLDELDQVQNKSESDSQTPAEDRMFAGSYPYGWQMNPYGAYNNVPRYPPSNPYGSYRNPWGSQLYYRPTQPKISPVPPLPPPYTYFPPRSPVPQYPYQGQGNQGWNSGGQVQANNLPYQKNEIIDPEQQSPFYKSKSKQAAAKGKKSLSSQNYSEDTEECECNASDFENEMDEFGCHCLFKTRVKKNAKELKNKYKKRAINKNFLNKKPCKYGYNSGPNGGCKPKPRTTPRPEPDYYDEEEEEEFEIYPVKCSKDNRKCLEKYFYGSAEPTESDVVFASGPKSRGLNNPSSNYKNQMKTNDKTATSKSNKYSEIYGKNGPLIKPTYYRNPKDKVKTFKKTFQTQMYQYNDKTGQFEPVAMDSHLEPQNLVPVQMDVNQPSSQGLGQHSIQPEVISIDPQITTSPTNPTQQIGTLPQSHMGFHQYSTQSLSPIINQLLSQGGLQYSHLNQGNLPYSFQLQNGNLPNTIPSQQLFPLPQGQNGIPVSMPSQTPQFISLGEMQVLSQSQNGGQQFFKPQQQPQGVTFNPSPVMQEGTQQFQVQNSQYQSQPFGNQNVFQIQTAPPQYSTLTQPQVASASSQYVDFQSNQNTFQPLGTPQYSQSQQSGYSTVMQPQGVQIQTVPPTQYGGDTSIQNNWPIQSSNSMQTQQWTPYSPKEQSVMENYQQQKTPQYSQSGFQYSYQASPTQETKFHSQPPGTTQSSSSFQPQFGNQNSYPHPQQPQPEFYQQYASQTQGRNKYSSQSEEGMQNLPLYDNNDKKPEQLFTPERITSTSTSQPTQIASPMTNQQHETIYGTRSINNKGFEPLRNSEPQIFSMTDQSSITAENSSPEVIYQSHTASNYEDSINFNFKDGQNEQQSSSNQVQYRPIEYYNGNGNPSRIYDYNRPPTPCELNDAHNRHKFNVPIKSSQSNHNSGESPPRSKKSKWSQGRFSRKEENSEKVINIGPSLDPSKSSQTENSHLGQSNPRNSGLSAESPNLSIAIHLHNFNNSGLVKETAEGNANDIVKGNSTTPVYNRKGKEFAPSYEIEDGLLVGTAIPDLEINPIDNEVKSSYNSAVEGHADKTVLATAADETTVRLFNLSSSFKVES